MTGHALMSVPGQLRFRVVTVTESTNETALSHFLVLVLVLVLVWNPWDRRPNTSRMTRIALWTEEACRHSPEHDQDQDQDQEESTR